MLKHKHIVVGVTGGIAAYKIPLLIRELKKGMAEIRIVMTEAATEFVTPLTLSALSQNEVVVGMFPDEKSRTINAGTWHITLGRWADVMLIAPATANTIGKLAHGCADDSVTTLALAVRCPVIISPAMDVDMWQHSATRENISRLRELGYQVLPPEEGELASGLTGIGRMPGIDVLLRALDDVLTRVHQDFKGKKILVSAGPTREAIDPVRFIGNRSSGRMGFALENAASLRGAEVTLVTGPVELQTPLHVRRIDVESAEQMHSAVIKGARNADVVIMAAAVADFTPVKPSSRKIKKESFNGGTLSIEFRKTKDILRDLAQRQNGPVTVGFALETHNDLRNAREKLREKKLDLIVLNNPLREGAGFETETNIVTILSKRGKAEKLKKMKKFDVANEILDRVKKIL